MPGTLRRGAGGELNIHAIQYPFGSHGEAESIIDTERLEGPTVQLMDPFTIDWKRPAPSLDTIAPSVYDIRVTVTLSFTTIDCDNVRGNVHGWLDDRIDGAGKRALGYVRQSMTWMRRQHLNRRTIGLQRATRHYSLST